MGTSVIQRNVEDPTSGTPDVSRLDDFTSAELSAKQDEIFDKVERPDVRIRQMLGQAGHTEAILRGL